jgi:hypothetical protein
LTGASNCISWQRREQEQYFYYPNPKQVPFRQGGGLSTRHFNINRPVFFGKSGIPSGGPATRMQYQYPRGQYYRSGDFARSFPQEIP